MKILFLVKEIAFLSVRNGFYVLSLLKTERNMETNDVQGRGEVILYQTEDGQTQLDVKLENETVWLTQS